MATTYEGSCTVQGSDYWHPRRCRVTNDHSGSSHGLPVVILDDGPMGPAFGAGYEPDPSLISSYTGLPQSLWHGGVVGPKDIPGLVLGSISADHSPPPVDQNWALTILTEPKSPYWVWVEEGEAKDQELRQALRAAGYTVES